MPRSRASDEAFSSLLTVNILSLVFIPSLSFEFYDIALHILTTIFYNVASVIFWLVMYNSLLYLRVSIPAVSTYWNRIAPAFRVLILCILLSLFCCDFRCRAILVGLTSSYFVEEYKRLTSRSALVARPGVASGNVAAQHDTRFVDPPSPSNVANRSTLPSLRRVPDTPPIPTITPFGDRILPAPLSSGRGKSWRSSGGRQTRQSTSSQHHQSKLNDDEITSSNSRPLQGGRQSAEALADGRPRNSGQSAPNPSPVESSKRKRKVDVDVEQPQSKRKSSVDEPSHNNRQDRDEGQGGPTTGSGSLWQHMYNGISAFVGVHNANDSSTVKRKRSDDDLQQDAKRPVTTNNKIPSASVMSTVPSSSTRSSTKRSHPDPPQRNKRPADRRDEVTAETVTSPAPRKQKVEFTCADDSNEKVEESKVETYEEASMLPQSKYLQDLLKKRERQVSSSESETSVMIRQASTGPSEHSARPSLHRRSSSTVSQYTNVTNLVLILILISNMICFAAFQIYIVAGKS